MCHSKGKDKLDAVVNRIFPSKRRADKTAEINNFNLHQTLPERSNYEYVYVRNRIHIKFYAGNIKAKKHSEDSK